jgi:hypothetical protein
VIPSSVEVLCAGSFADREPGEPATERRFWFSVKEEENEEEEYAVDFGDYDD